MKLRELLSEIEHFDDIVAQNDALFRKLESQVGGNPSYVRGACDRAIRFLKLLKPTDAHEELYVEVMIEAFEELRSKTIARS